MRRVHLASIGVNKAADYYTTAEALLPLPGPPSHSLLAEPDDAPPSARARRPKEAAPRSSHSVLSRLRERERALDRALEASYQRFCAGEITARELDAERRTRVREFNRVVEGENIRYRGMLRKL